MTGPAATGTGAVPGVDVVEQAAGIIGVAFADLPLSGYLMPGTDRITKVGILAGHLRLAVAHAHRHGSVQTDPGGVAAAAWMDLYPVPPPEIAGYAAKRAAVCGVFTDRFARFEDAMHAHHQRYVGATAHSHLALLGVVPARQGRGLGSALIRQRLLHLDIAATGCFVEASSTRSRDLYHRHGFRALGDPYPVGPDGPLMHPLWRDPGAPAQPPATRRLP
ncbi:ribosomal protein S18 acetylase RimI-like enzyme [Allocatelliglobosispora scoriae]|uniref:Ribosomal protein S18 acetylase RimI-like enzyme n=1 Tax=Allocatelliglobosispora scoriae TaxID=643052 RepID=A0A841BP30_9ACTN|nr:GNAT family N-acetyltransferase [Allocatelliglobosispora scoriae]MBB5868570.1 ribosomal protein S18 acetylase RimI-like enzyme [Allocatelliglobosispora scoriae]